MPPAKQPADAKPKLIVRNALIKDIPGIRALSGRAYPDFEPDTAAQLRGQIQNFPDGQFVVIYEDKVVGYCATFRIVEAAAFRPHTWQEITGGGFDMVLTSSTPSLQAVATANDRGRVRHVFAAVADPFSAGVGLDRADPLVHPRHLVGYGSLAPVHATFGILRRINPRVARVGVAHNPSESNSRRFMELARASCRARGIELLEAAVENSSGVVEAVQSTIARGAEAIFVPGDTTVASACDSVVAVAGKAGVPVFTLVPGKPDRGTFFDVGFDFREVGLLAGRLAGDLLDGRDPAGVPIGETAREIPPRLTVNLSAPGADPAVWRVPDDLLAQAKVVIDTAGRRDRPEAVLAGPFEEAPADR
jgi:ABC-type uncharacterized transport system substrate-binding protein